MSVYVSIFKILLIFVAFLISNPALSDVINKWPFGTKAAVSMTYDDGYIDNIDVAAPALESYGYRGTFYLTKDIVLQENARTGRGVYALWKGLHLKGHEIGSHGIHHTCSGVTGSLNDANSILVEVEQSRTWLNAAIGSDPFRSYAYPCGETDSLDENGVLSTTYYPEYVGDRYYVARGTKKGLNLSSEIMQKRTSLNAYAITPENASVAYVESILAQAETQREWVIFVFHSIGNGPYGISASLHNQIIAHIYNRGVFWVAPVREVAMFSKWYR